MIYPNDADGDALRRVEALGADMRKPMSIDFAVDVSDEIAGQRVARLAQQMGFETKVVFDPGEDDDPSWTCYCTKTMLATYTNVVATQSELRRIAKEFGGSCESWGTSGNGVAV